MATGAGLWLGSGMHVDPLHPDEAPIDEQLVRRLLVQRLPEHAADPLLLEPDGTDNYMIRLAGGLVARLPRTAQAEASLRKELEWLPLLAPHLPVAVPTAVTLGSPGFGYPYIWSVYRWIPGESPPPGNATPVIAADLARFCLALRAVDTFGLHSSGTLHSYRGDSIRLRDARTRESIDQCDRWLDRALVHRVWSTASAVVDFAGPWCWTHTDLQPGNLLIRAGRLAGVIDWGGLTLGDPAIEGIVAWTYLTPSSREVFRVAAEFDDDQWRRGRAWALSIALVALPYYAETHVQMTRWARYTIDQVCTDVLAEASLR